MSKNRRLIVLSLIICLALACNLPSGAATASPAAGDGSASPTVTETTTSTATTVALTATACLPTVITNVDANVRSGPGQVYSILGQLPQGSSANVGGKNSDGSWWFIEFAAGPNGHAWIAGSVTTATCIPDTLAIVAAPPTPIPPTFTNTPIPTFTPTVTNTPLVLVPLPFPPIILLLGDISLDDVFLSAGGEVVARISVSGSMSGNFQYKVYVDGSLQATKNDTLPVGSQVYYSGVVLVPNIFDQTNTVKVVVDPANSISELHEDNNAKSVDCNNVSRSC